MNVTDAVATAVSSAPDAVFVASLGTATSALRAVSGDAPHVYLGGAMGSAMAVALGLADARVAPVIALVGDGEFLMGASSLWSLAGVRPANLAVIVLADGQYAITGGQRLGAPSCAAATAAALPGLASERVSTQPDLARVIRGLPRPAVIEAVVSSHAWPGPSPFVDPQRVRLSVQARLARPAGPQG